MDMEIGKSDGYGYGCEYRDRTRCGDRSGYKIKVDYGDRNVLLLIL